MVFWTRRIPLVFENTATTAGQRELAFSRIVLLVMETSRSKFAYASSAICKSACYIFRDGAVNDLYRAPTLKMPPPGSAAIRGIRNDRTIPHNEGALIVQYRPPVGLRYGQ